MKQTTKFGGPIGVFTDNNVIRCRQIAETAWHTSRRIVRTTRRMLDSDTNGFGNKTSEIYGAGTEWDARKL